MQSVLVLTVARQDSVDAACEALRNAAPGSQVWLVLPWRAGWGLRLINLKRLRRAAESAALDLRLVSGHVQTRILARTAGLATYAMTPLRLRRYAQRLRSPSVAAARIAAAIPPRLQRLQRRPKTLRFGGALAGLLSIALLVSALGATGALLVPNARVTLRPITKSVSASFAVQASPQAEAVDYGGSIVPGRTIYALIGDRLEAPATGNTPVPDGYASGEVVFANRSDQAVTVPKGTVVRNGAGIGARFLTVSDVEVPGQLYAQARVGILAAEPGPQSNVPPLTINIVEGDIAYRVDALNPQATHGGSVKRVPQVTEADLKGVYAALIEKLRERTAAELNKELQPGEFIPPGATGELAVFSYNYEQTPGQQSAIAAVRMQVSVAAIAVNESGLKQLAIAYLERSASGEAYALVPDSLSITSSSEGGGDAGQGVFQVRAAGQVAPVINTAQVQRALRGQPLAQAQAWLDENLELAEPAQIELLPIQWERLPWLPARLRVRISSEAG